MSDLEKATLMDNWWCLSQITSEWDDRTLVKVRRSRVFAASALSKNKVSISTWFSTRDLFSSPQTQKKQQQKKTKTKNKTNKQRTKKIFTIKSQLVSAKWLNSQIISYSFLVDAWWGGNSFIFGVQNKKTRTQYYS